MQRRSAGGLIFVIAAALAAALYFFSAPGGTPWLGAEPRAGLRVWRWMVRLAQGDVVFLAGLGATVAGGLLGTIVNRYAGWRVAVAAVLVWITLPWVWNGVVLGRCSVCLASVAVAAAWVLNVLILWTTRRARRLRARKEEDDAAAEDVEKVVYLSPRSLAWKFLFAGVAFAVLSVANHDWRLGQAASVYAHGVVDEAAGRVIVLNGAADEQIAEVAGTIPDGTALLFDQTASTRANLVAWVKSTWPGETNLWLTAEVGVDAFARTAVRLFPSRFYLMTGESTTFAGWSARWAAAAPYARSRDPFVPVMRRAFAVEGNALGNRLQATGQLAEAWKLYWRIYSEVEPDNSAALVNLGGMLKGGYAAEKGPQAKVEAALAALVKRTRSGQRPTGVRRLVEDRRSPEVRRQAVEQRGPEGRRGLVAWSNEMIASYNAGDLDKAARIARAILTRPDGLGCLPAYAVLGAALAREGDYAMSEVCYRVAVEGAGETAPRAALFNDYADTLRHLKRFVEAERYARLAIVESGGKAWLCKLTLAEVLQDAGKAPDEVRSLLAEVERLKLDQGRKAK